MREARRVLVGVVWIAGAFATGCGSHDGPRYVPPGPLSAPDVPACCVDYAELRALDGQRVAVTGVYRTVAIMQGARDPSVDAAARTASVNDILLDIYDAPEGTRSEEEIARFRGRRVRVVGTLHASTPQPPGGSEQRMTGPCLTGIESIQALE